MGPRRLLDTKASLLGFCWAGANVCKWCGLRPAGRDSAAAICTARLKCGVVNGCRGSVGLPSADEPKVMTIGGQWGRSRLRFSGVVFGFGAGLGLTGVSRVVPVTRMSCCPPLVPLGGRLGEVRGLVRLGGFRPMTCWRRWCGRRVIFCGHGGHLLSLAIRVREVPVKVLRGGPGRCECGRAGWIHHRLPNGLQTLLCRRV